MSFQNWPTKCEERKLKVNYNESGSCFEKEDEEKKGNRWENERDKKENGEGEQEG